MRWKEGWEEREREREKKEEEVRIWRIRKGAVCLHVKKHPICLKMGEASVKKSVKIWPVSNLGAFRFNHETHVGLDFRSR